MIRAIRQERECWYGKKCFKNTSGKKSKEEDCLRAKKLIENSNNKKKKKGSTELIDKDTVAAKKKNDGAFTGWECECKCVRQR